ncbi:MAG TPA: ABC transporter permease [Mycobacteriales bacterium]|jgi:peptide/nickel transport system permease protein|nr:ABC transporter permease [Mycobacteriales bacterium]
MISYILRRFVSAVIVVFGIMFVTFTMLHIIAPSPARAVLGIKASPAAIAGFNHANGYDRPFLRQFVTYVNQTLHGNLGYSYKLNQSVSDLFKENAGRSALLSGISLFLAVVIAVPLGIYQAVKRNSISDYVLTGVSFTLYSMPIFFLSLILIDLFALKSPIFPFEASQATTVIGVLKDPRSMVLPIASLVALTVAGYSRYMRSSALDNLAQDYIKVARAKGLPERAVLRRHLIRNSSLPMVTLVGLSIPDLLAGNLVTEQVFNYPGLGLLFFNSLLSEDYPILLAYTLVGGVLVVLGNFIADIALTVTDPRIRLT